MSFARRISHYTHTSACARECRRYLPSGKLAHPQTNLPRLNNTPKCSRRIGTASAGLISMSSGSIYRRTCSIIHSEQILSRIQPRRRYASTTAITEITKTSCRTHTCGGLRATDVSQQVQLTGWIVTKRTFGNDMRFMPLRDAYGTTQLTYAKSTCSSEVWDVLEKASTESVISITGDVRLRPEGQSNDDMPTGAIEVVVTAAQVLGPCDNLPFPLDDNNVGASMTGIRMERRYLALRSDVLQRNIRLRAKVASATRRYLEDHEFVEIETPLLFRRTPEGAREFVVPARAPGTFYALPQSPQQYKQLLMVGGFDRYFQFARCFRDEDLRADRQPEFTQLDVEMSFVTMQDVMALGERVCKNMWATAGYNIPEQPFRHMTYTDAMTSYGCDKPDLRFGMRLKNLDAPFADSSADFLRIAANEQSKSVVGFNLGKWSKSLSRKDVDALVKQVRASGCETATFIQVTANATEWNWKSSIAKFLTNEVKEQLKSALSLQEGDLVIVGLGPTNKTLEAMGKVRLQCASELERKGLPVRPAKGSTNEFEFLWVTDFPLFTPEDATEQPTTSIETERGEGEVVRLGTTHHPFTAPHVDDMKYLDGTVEDMMKIRGQHFDLVVNGVELGGGSIRIHSSDVQRKVLQDCLKVDDNNFEHLLTALDSGCPPHGGFALGFDRAMALLTQAESLRDVIAFPKSFSGKEPMTSSPAPLSEEDLDVYSLQFKPSADNS